LELRATAVEREAFVDMCKAIQAMEDRGEITIFFAMNMHHERVSARARRPDGDR